MPDKVEFAKVVILKNGFINVFIAVLENVNQIAIIHSGALNRIIAMIGTPVSLNQREKF